MQIKPLVWQKKLVLTFADWPVSLQEIWLQVDLKQVASNSFYCVIYWKNMNPLSILHIRTWLNAEGDNSLKNTNFSKVVKFFFIKLCAFTYLMTSPRRTLRLLRTTLFMRTFSSEQVSSDSTIHTVSRLFFPFISTVSPRKSCSSSILVFKHIKPLFCEYQCYYLSWQIKVLNLLIKR